MADSIDEPPRVDVILVDGVGNPRIVPLAVSADGTLPPCTKYPHDGYQPGPFRHVQFDRDPHPFDGRPVYRLSGSGFPEIRPAYLRMAPIGPFNTPRVES